MKGTLINFQLLTAKISLLIITCTTLALLQGCKKDDKNTPDPVATANIDFHIRYHVDGKQLEFDTMLYKNAAGNEYSVSRLHYYIAGLILLPAKGNPIRDKTVHYIDAKEAATNTFNLKNMPAGNYSGISLLIGLDSISNKTGFLPATIENMNMAWPDMMGGGYHFLKLEGHFRDTISVTGFALHIGTDECLVKVDIDQPFAIGPEHKALQLSMNLNEWFERPFTYDLATGHYTMGISLKMLKIAQNGKDVFTLD